METELEMICKRIYLAIERTGKSYAEIAKLADIPPATVHRYATGRTTKIPIDRIKLLARATGVSAAWLMGWETTLTGEPIPYGMHAPRFRKVPRLGRIRCGEPNAEEEVCEGYDEVPDGITCDFTLRCEGDSMINAQINDGDIVYIRSQRLVENGEIAAVRIDGETTLKRFYKRGDTVTLSPENPRYEPIVRTGEELRELEILGKAVGFTRIFR